MIVKLRDLKVIYEEEIRKNVKNKRKILEFEKNKFEYLVDIKNILERGDYKGGKYNIFLIYKPKVRVIMSQNIYDKIINHYVARFILLPKLEKYLSDRNTATRKGMGSSYAIHYLKKDIEYFKKYDNFYFLKLDIKKYFYNIDQDILLSNIKNELGEEEFNLVKNIVYSTNYSYVNKVIENYEKKLDIELSKYEYKKGLPIGNMTSQFLAIFYLSNLQHFIRHNLKLRYINYMDDYVIMHNDIDYLKKCLKIIEEKLNKEYKLQINLHKTMITKSSVGVNFLGYKFSVKNKKTIVRLSSSAKSNIKKGIKRTKYLYKNNIIALKSMFSSIETYKNSYKYVNKKYIKELIEYYWL